jgi:hypothetical protein
MSVRCRRYTVTVQIFCKLWFTKWKNTTASFSPQGSHFDSTTYVNGVSGIPVKTLIQLFPIQSDVFTAVDNRSGPIPEGSANAHSIFVHNPVGYTSISVGPVKYTIFELHTAKKIVFIYMGIARPQYQFPHSCVCERFLYSHAGSYTYFLQQNRKIDRGNIWIGSLTDTWMWKLGLWPRNSFSGNIFFSNFRYWFFAVWYHWIGLG